MSELLGEARILIRPDTTKFRAELEAQLAAVSSKPITVPVVAQTGKIGANVNQEIQKQVTSTKELAAAQSLQAKSAAEVSAAQRAHVLAAQGIISQEDRAALATRAAATANRNLQQALLGTDQAAIGAAATTANLARAEAELAGTSAAASRAQSQLSRGIFANILQTLGLRGATLAASGAFIAGAAATIGFIKAISAASALNEEVNKTKVVFDSSAEAVLAWGRTTATSFGISEEAALKAANQFGNLLRPIGILPGQSAAISEQLVKLASDLASFNNADPSRVLEALRSGLVGQARPLRIYGILLSQARVNQEALKQTGKDSITQLTDQDRVLARLNIILHDSTLAQGDFARTSKEAANQSRTLKANISDMAATFGNNFLPAIKRAEQATNLLLSSFRAAPQAELGGITLTAQAAQNLNVLLPTTQRFVDDLFATLRQQGGAQSPTALNAFITGLAKLRDELQALGPAGEQVAGRLQQVIDQIARTGQVPSIDLSKLFFIDPNEVKRKADALKKAFLLPFTGPDIANAGAAFWNLFASGITKAQQGQGPGSTAKTARTFVENLSTQIAIAQSSGASDATLIALFQKQIADAQTRLQQLLRRPQTPKVQQRERAESALISSAKSQIQTILSKQTSDAKQAAQDIQDARTKADEAFLKQLFKPQAGIELRLLRAQGTQMTADDLAVEKILLRFITSAIARIKRAVNAGKLSRAAAHDAIQTLKTQQQQTKNEIDSLARDQAQQQTNTQQQILQINIQIAQTTGNTAAEKRADEAYIKFLERQIKKAKGDRLRIKQLQLELAQTKADLKKLTQQAKSNATAQAEFTFLQTQTGFVSNLLGNLIPLGSTGGLVGGGRPTTPSNVRQPLATARTQAQANRTPGVTSGQGETQIYWLKQIAIYLKRLNEGRDHPEAHHQRKVGAAAYDYGYQGPGM